MKHKFLATLLILNSSLLFAEVPENHCSPVLESKRYIGELKPDYPRTVTFECTYECRVEGKIHAVRGVKEVRINNMEDDARMTACQGVMVKKVPWGYDFDKIVPFYAYQTSMKEIKEFAFDHIDRSNPNEKELLLGLKQNLTAVSTAYKATGVSYMRDAAGALEKVAKELPGKTQLLDKYVSDIVRKRGQIVLAPDAASLILINIKANADWRIPPL